MRASPTRHRPLLVFLAKMLADGPHVAGRHTVTLSGTALASGIYFVQMTANGFTETKKVVVLD